VPRITRKPTGAYHHGNLRDAIVAAAGRMVADDGVTELTIRKVAERLGVTHAAIYHHFEDRTAMLAAVAERALHQLGDSATTPSSMGALERFRAIGAAYVKFALDHPHVYQAIFRLERSSRDRYAGLAAARARLFGLMRAAIVTCQGEGIVRDGSPDEHTLFCWSAVHGFASLVTEGQTKTLDLPTDPVELGDIVIDRIFFGLATPEMLAPTSG
jgi:AcrR family transcriptional regulator